MTQQPQWPWRSMSSAPTDRKIIVFAPASEGFPDLVCFCEWSPIAGFFIDEFRMPTMWMPWEPEADKDAPKLETGPELLQRLGDDAAKWAAEFRQTATRLGYSDMDEMWLIGWFANAIENSCDVRRWRLDAADTSPIPPDRVPEALRELAQIVRAYDSMERRLAPNFPQSEPFAFLEPEMIEAHASQARAAAVRIVEDLIPQVLPQSRWEALVNAIAAALDRAAGPPIFDHPRRLRAQADRIEAALKGDGR